MEGQQEAEGPQGPQEVEGPKGSQEMVGLQEAVELHDISSNLIHCKKLTIVGFLQ